MGVQIGEIPQAELPDRMVYQRHFLYVVPYLHSHTSPRPDTQLAKHNDGSTFIFTITFFLTR
jgi:hypothetical protein